jgi:hypothetical protein
MQTDPPIGTLIGGFRVESLLADGGMGRVYLARQDYPSRQVALKVIGEPVCGNSELRDRFLRESRVAVEIEHPNIVPVYSAGDEDGVLYLAMRYITSGDLQRLLRDQPSPLTLERATNLLRPIAAALDFAHSRGIVHRDVKPGNVLVDRHGPIEHPYLTDFGVTKLVGSTDLTLTGHVIGTAEYMAPELFEGQAADGKADQYSHACLLFRCVTGEVPFPRRDLPAQARAHVEARPPSLSETQPSLPTALDKVVHRAMAKKRKDRYASCTEFMTNVASIVARSSRDRVGGLGARGGVMPVGADAVPTLPLESTSLLDSRGVRRDVIAELRKAATRINVVLSWSQLAEWASALREDEDLLMVVAPCVWQHEVKALLSSSFETTVGMLVLTSERVFLRYAAKDSSGSHEHADRDRVFDRRHLMVADLYHHLGSAHLDLLVEKPRRSIRKNPTIRSTEKITMEIRPDAAADKLLKVLATTPWDN